jgi:hypothetical protein
MNMAPTTGLFTGVSPDRYHLPHPRLALPVVLLIRRVLLRAFELLREQKYDLASAKEDEITAALRSTIENNLRQTGEVPGFGKRTFEHVSRQAQCANYDGTKWAKAPDLFFKLRDDEHENRPVLSEHDGLFIEAKPVDAAHSAGRKYCDDGLFRFVCGDYAWAMQDAMMIAYVRDNRTIAKHLIPAMNETDRMTSLATLQLPTACLASGAAACSEAESVHISQHRRNFSWPDAKGPACEITVYHLWHRCST